MRYGADIGWFIIAKFDARVANEGIIYLVPGAVRNDFMEKYAPDFESVLGSEHTIDELR